MKTKILIPSLLIFLCAACSTPSGQTQSGAPSSKTVNVVFSNPEKFTDVKSSSMESDKDRDYLLGELKEHIISRASTYMAANQTLDVTITDVDMAGDFEPWRGPRAQDVRIVKDIYPPRIDLSFKLTDASGGVLAEDTRQLRDLNFMMTMPTFPSDDTLRYEKNLLNSWLSNDLGGINKK